MCTVRENWEIKRRLRDLYQRMYLLYYGEWKERKINIGDKIGWNIEMTIQDAIQDMIRTLSEREPRDHLWRLENIWREIMREIEGETIIREEEYEMKDGNIMMIGWEEEREENKIIIKVIGKLEYKENKMQIVVKRYIDERKTWKSLLLAHMGILTNKVVLYEDDKIYREENYQYVKEDYEIEGEWITRIKQKTRENMIFKDDLFRSEFHTIPFKTIHEELLYSLDTTPKWFINEARRAHQHFTILTTNQ